MARLHQEAQRVRLPGRAEDLADDPDQVLPDPAVMIPVGWAKSPVVSSVARHGRARFCPRVHCGSADAWANALELRAKSRDLGLRLCPPYNGCDAIRDTQ